MERMLRVQTVIFGVTGFSSMSPESKRKARRNGLRKKRVRERGSRRTVGEVTELLTVCVVISRKQCRHRFRDITTHTGYVTDCEPVTYQFHKDS